MKFKGTIHKYGDNVNTDVIIPARHCNTIDPAKLAKHCLEDLDAGFVKKVKTGDILIGGFNFGCGSSREVAPIAIKASGIVCVVANSFARIFYRNAVNIGLPIIEAPDAADDASDEDQLEIDFNAGKLRNLTRNKEYHFSKDTGVIREIVQAGGLVNYVREAMKR